MYTHSLLFTLPALPGFAWIDKLRQPALICTPEGDLLHANAAALTLLATTTLVMLPHERLRFAAQAQAEFRAGCALLARRFDLEAESGEFRLLQVESPHEKLYAFYTAVAQTLALDEALRPGIAVFFYHPATAPVLDETLLRQTLRLSPMECRIATMLAEGLSVKKIAGIFGTQQDTVRKQLQSIYKKTATKRQSELIRLLLNLPSYALEPLPADLRPLPAEAAPLRLN